MHMAVASELLPGTELSTANHTIITTHFCMTSDMDLQTMGCGELLSTSTALIQMMI
jgi:hypothetical protein